MRTNNYNNIKANSFRSSSLGSGWFASAPGVVLHNHFRGFICKILGQKCRIFLSLYIIEILTLKNIEKTRTHLGVLFVPLFNTDIQLFKPINVRPMCV